ncbi:hypothetical protein ABTE40_21950, partial [Acinetobacter baumannii]
MPSDDKPRDEQDTTDCLASARRLGLARAAMLFPDDVTVASAAAARNRALLPRGLPPQLEPWSPPRGPGR